MTNLQKDWPSLSCPSSNVSRFWSHEWEKHGTCSESQIDQHDYFEAALNQKKKVNLQQILRIARIEPDDGFYSLDNILSDLMTNLQKDWPSLSCPSSNVSRFWSHEWEKHGTCSESQIDQHDYFEAALNQKKKVNLQQILRIARIEPDDGFYSLDNIVRAIIKGIGHTSRIECNKDSHGNSQLY
nr:ribonuclease 3 [Quercus suber]